jgi:hypothetical protein
VNDPDVLAIMPWAAVSVVLCASLSLIDTVPAPEVKVTDAGYTGAFPPGELAGRRM